MLKKYKTLLIITVLLCLTPIILGVSLWDRLPDPIPTHFGIDGQPNGWSSRNMAVFGIPAFMAAMELFCAVAMRIDPKSGNISSKPMVIVFVMMPVLSWFCAYMIYGSALGRKMNIGSVTCLFIGALFIALGNYLPKNARNYSFGIRTPWALDDDENWTRTNRVGSVCLMAGGAAIFLCGLLTIKNEAAGMPVFITVMAVAVAASLVPTVYSYLYFRRHGKGEKEGEAE